MADFNSKYTGEEVEQLLDKVEQLNVTAEDTNDIIDDPYIDPYIKYVYQSLTEEQKAQARNNIGVPSMEQLMAMYQELLGMINNLQN